MNAVFCSYCESTNAENLFDSIACDKLDDL